MFKKLNNNNGSTLLLVMMVSVVLSILLLSLSNTSIVNTRNNQATFQSEKAYLAARSGYELMCSMGKDSTKSDKIRASREKNPIKMDFGDLGNANVSVFTTTKWVQDYDASGNPLYIDASGNQTLTPTATPKLVEVVDDERVKVECVGDYDGKKFKLVRYVSLKLGTTTSHPFEKRAYTQYGNKDIEVDGGIDGPVLIVGDAKVTVKNAQNVNAMHEIICSGNLDMASNGTDNQFDFIVAGGYLKMGAGMRVLTDVLVGTLKPDGSSDSFFTGIGPVIYGALKCEGHIVLDTATKIGLSNWDTTTASVIDPTAMVLYSGEDIYIGYGFTATGDPTTKNNSGMDFYGGIVCGGDLHISGTTRVYGDIICDGNVFIENNATFYGNIYARGNVVDTGSSTTGAAMFPTGAAIYAGGVVSTKCPNENGNLIDPATGNCTSTVLAPKLSMYFNGVDYVGAEAYLDAEIFGAPKPMVKIPDKFNTMTPYVFNTVESTCWWCMDIMPHVAHTKYELADNVVVINSDCVIDTDLSLGGWTNKTLYFDASDNDIDVLLDCNINITDGARVVVNDGAGQHRVRLFMKDGATINLKSNAGLYAILPVSDAKADMADTEVTNLDAIIDYSKIPQLYIFAENDSNTTISLGGGAQYIPGYVIAPSLAIDTSGGMGAHHYRDEDGEDGSEVTKSKYPFVNGLLVCDHMDFSKGTCTFVRYDRNLEDLPDGSPSPTGQKFTAALADVIYYNTTP